MMLRFGALLTLLCLPMGCATQKEQEVDQLGLQVGVAADRGTWVPDIHDGTGRGDHLIVFSPSSPWRFNFLDSELRRPGAGAGLTENILRLFLTIAEIATRA